ncbi:hypothetical protein [Blautia sp. MSJ-19]|uniref:hypothetical protein n=1 Tax=Blautia sp. MSJ-19 TaxID=2841517 RepID=UPI001C0F2811|nr:hypothetical protein [Blautia sp. MSJ-19]MBU5481960.1 hypothetical protein [Blautia sp. MSJ-19]
MKKTKKSTFIRKGDFGYLASEKKKRILITTVLFAVPLLIFFSAILYFHTRLTIWTVIAVVGCLPACKSLVSLIMLFRAKPVDASVYHKIHEHAGALTMSYEMYMTFYEKSANIDAFAICGNTVVGYSSDPKVDAAFMEQECQKILRGNSFKATVKIFTRLEPFLERLDSMNAHKESLEEGIKFRPDEKYPELSRNELIKHTILAICL